MTNDQRADGEIIRGVEKRRFLKGFITIKKYEDGPCDNWDGLNALAAWVAGEYPGQEIVSRASGVDDKTGRPYWIIHVRPVA